MTTKPEEKFKKTPLTFFGLSINNHKTPYYLFAIVTGLWVINGLVLFSLDGSERGTFGDMFGTVNALFSGLAFAGIIYSILLQSEELKAQQKELRLTRKEFRLTRNEFVEQNKTLKQERFEDTFFRMLSTFNQIVSGITFKSNSIEGRSSFQFLYAKFIEFINVVKKDVYEKMPNRPSFQIAPSNDHLRIGLMLPDYIKAYNTFFSHNEEHLSHYFRTLYTILTFIDDAPDLTHDEKYVYTRIVRAQLSYYELGLLFYNCLSPHGLEKHKPLLEKYTMLKNLSDKMVFNITHKENYNKSAFERSKN